MVKNKGRLIAFGFSAIGINLMNLIVGSYLCDAMLTAGFLKNVENWTYLNKDIVIALWWGVFITVAKIIDGVIDVPLATFLDKLKSKIGRRRAGLLIGLVPLLAAFLLLLVPITKDNLALNTIYFGVLLIVFYISYTTVMLTFYASFAELTKNDHERQFLSDVKSVADVIYYVLGFALLPILVNFMNIRTVALCFLPFVLLIIIAFTVMKKEHSDESVKTPGIFSSLKSTIVDPVTHKPSDFVKWLGVYALMTFAIQMFLAGQNVFLSGAGLSGGGITIANACAFAPVPATIVLYNYIIKKKGFRVGFNYAMGIFTVGMAVCALLYIVTSLPILVLGAIGSVVCSFGIGTFFSVGYILPSHFGALAKEKHGVSNPSMYFAVQGLFGAVFAAISTGVVWVSLKSWVLKEGGAFYVSEKTTSGAWLLTPVVGIVLLICIVLTRFLPDSVSYIGKVKTDKK